MEESRHLSIIDKCLGRDPAQCPKGSRRGRQGSSRGDTTRAQVGSRARLLGCRAERLVWGAVCYEITSGEAGGAIHSNPPGPTGAQRTSQELPRTLGPCTSPAPRSQSLGQRGIWTPLWRHLLILPRDPMHPWTPVLGTASSMCPAQNPALSWLSRNVPLQYEDAVMGHSAGSGGKEEAEMREP